MTFKKIYLLQNTEEINEELCEKFKNCGYEVVGKTTDGNTAEKEIAEKSPDLLITEIVLPGSDGLKVIKNVRAKNPKLKVIVLSALNSEEAICEATKQGAAYFMVKPYSFEILSDSIMEIALKGEGVKN